MKRVSKILSICLVVLLGIFFASCSFKKENNETEKDTEYTLYVYSLDDTFIRQETVIRGEDKYVYFGGDVRYIFHGYFTEQNGKGNQITDSTGKVLKDFKAPGSSKAFAIYPYVSALTYTLTFVTNCEDVVPSETHTTEEDFMLPEVSKKGYRFVGWSTNPNDWTGLKNVYGGQYVQDTILYAIFSVETYFVTYHTGRDSDYGRLTIAYGENYTVPYVEVTGYNFVGYYTKENGQGQQLTDNDGNSLSPWALTENTVDIYAHYKTAQTVTLTIENNGLVTGINVTYKEWAWNNGQPSDKTVFYRNGAKIAYLSPDVREGYYFDGWYQDSGCRNEYDFTSAEYISDDIVLYAKWVELSSVQPKNILSKATDGYIRLKSGVNANNDMKFFCDFSGTITVHYKVEAFAGQKKTHGAHIGILDFDKDVADGESGSVEVTVKKGDILGITGKPIEYGEEPNLVYSFEGFPEILSQKEVKTPSEFTKVVTQGNYYTLPVYEQSGFIFVGYFSRSDGMGIQLTDDKGNSLSRWNGSNDATVYPYYVSRFE